MKTILQITPGGVKTTDSYGDTAAGTPELMLFCRTGIEFDLRGTLRKTSGELEKYSGYLQDISTWYLAIDNDFNSTTPPKILVTSGITLVEDQESLLLKVPVVHTGTDALVSDMADRTTGSYTAEIGGIDSGGDIRITWQFPISVRNRIYTGSGSETVAGDPDYYTAIQINAMLADKADRKSVYSRSEIDTMLGNVESELAEI